SRLRWRLAARTGGRDCRSAADRRRSRSGDPCGYCFPVNEPIVRIAARGDGVTPSGRHVPFGVPGDALLDDGALAYGPHHQEPPCRHFPECGGCQLQHADDEAYRGYLASRVETALAQHGLTSAIRPPYLSPPNSRRRATLKALRVGSGVLVGFNAQSSHRIVDMRECHILRPELFALVQPLRELLVGMLMPKRIADIQMTLIDGGADVAIKGVPAGRLAEVEQLTAFAMNNDLARLSVDRGLGPDTSCRRRRTAKRSWSPVSRKRSRAPVRPQTCSPGWARSRWRPARATPPRRRAMP